jgi:hypothetical protein
LRFMRDALLEGLGGEATPCLNLNCAC